jgi:hypothetical protein
MRRRLWAHICILDHQLAFGQASRLLTIPDEYEAPLEALPANLNDSDFDASTLHPPAPTTDFTDMTYALLAYQTIPITRLMNGRARQPDAKLDLRQYVPLVQQFERTARTLLQNCNPEASAYAWFTWHSSQYMVATGQLAALQPMTISFGKHATGQSAARAPSLPPTPTIEADADSEEHSAELLRLTLLILDKVHIIHTDPRGEGFLWSVNIPWHALAIAFSQVSVCTDMALLRRAWPLVEASLQQHKEALAAAGANRNLEELMRRARERVNALGVVDVGGEDAGMGVGGAVEQGVVAGEQAGGFGMVDSTLPNVDLSVEPLFPVEEWNSFPLSIDFDLDMGMLDEHLLAPRYQGGITLPGQELASSISGAGLGGFGLEAGGHAA